MLFRSVTVIVFAPAVVEVTVHLELATVQVAVLSPSLTVTFPLGVPEVEVTE